MTLAILLSSRAAGRYLRYVAACCLLSVALSRYGMKIHWASGNPAVAIPMPQLCAVLLITAGLAVMRPRMWLIDRLGVPRRRWVPATSAAVAALAGPQLALGLAAAVALPAGFWLPSSVTVLLLASVALACGPFVGAFRAGGLVLVLYFALTITAQLDPTINAWSPLAVVTWPFRRDLVEVDVPRSPATPARRASKPIL